MGTFKPYAPCPHPDACRKADFCTDAWRCAGAMDTLMQETEVTLTLEQQYPVLRYFHYEHLPPHLRAVSQPFCELAVTMCHLLPRNAETSTMLRKLLEAKDCAVRANVTDKDHPAPKEAR